MKKSVLQRVLPASSILIFSALSAGTVLASDPCKISLVRKLTEATHVAAEHTSTRRTHTRATLSKWEKWGQAYLAKHGHPYVPPKHDLLADDSPGKPDDYAPFTFSCEVPPLTTFTEVTSALLPPEDLTPFLPGSDDTNLVADNMPPTDIPDTPGTVAAPGTPATPGTVDTPSTPSPDIPSTPILYGGAPGTVPVTPPIVPVVPIAPTPEPSSWLLLGTGMAGLALLRSRFLAQSVSRSEPRP